jgi:hypothetical protein
MRRLCTAKRKNGEPCRGAAMRGIDKCRMHAGKAAAVVKLQAEAAEQLARLDVAPVEDPLSELAKVCGQVLAWKDSMAEKVNALEGKLRYESHGEGSSGEQLRAEVALWERSLDRCERFLTAMARLNIDERLAKISEERAELMVTVLTAALERAGIGGEQAEAVFTAFDEEFARQAGVRL